MYYWYNNCYRFSIYSQKLNSEWDHLPSGSPPQIYAKYSKEVLIDKIEMLEVENKKLRLDNARLRVLRSLSEGKISFQIGVFI